MLGRGDTTTWGYRPHLDGLRAVAVCLVVAFHSSADRIAGGFIGVDVFFVLSGYLVTNLLVRDLDESGAVRFGRFYSRRAKRLLPAAAVNLIATAVVFAVIAAPVELDAASRAIRAAALYVANWFFIGESTDYFGADIDASPVAHYWSLSIEEQFYLLWPLLLTGLHLVTRRAGSHRQAVTRGVVMVAGLVSLGAALQIATTDLNRAYYGTDTRAYQLLAGAALALTPSLVSWLASRRAAARVLPAAALGLLSALLLLGTSVVEVGPVTRGAMVTALTCGLIVSLEAAPGLVRSVLSWSPVVYLGKISYGTYLWHWLVIVVITRTYELSGLGTLAVALPVATGLASLSYQILEHPIRVAAILDRPRMAVIGCGLAMSAVVGLVIAPHVLDRASADTGRVEATTTWGTPVPLGVGPAFFDLFDFGACPAGHAVTCVLVEGDGPKILVVGESHAAQLTPMLSRIAERHDAELSGGYLDFCPWTKGLKYAGVGRTCFAEQQKMFNETIPALDPDIVVLVHRAVDDPVSRLDLVDADAGLVQPGTDEATAATRKRVTELVDGLRAQGRKVVMVEPVPVSPRDANPLTCLSSAEFVEECRFVTHSGPLPEEAIMRELADADDGVWSLDLDALVCPYLPICDPVVQGLIVRRDDNHITTLFGTEVLLDPVDAYLVDNDILR